MLCRSCFRTTCCREIEDWIGTNINGSNLEYPLEYLIGNISSYDPGLLNEYKGATESEKSSAFKPSPTTQALSTPSYSLSKLSPPLLTEWLPSLAPSWVSSSWH